MKKLRKSMPIIVLVSVLAATAIPGTLALLWGSTDRITNTFYPDPEAVIVPVEREEIKTLPHTGDNSSLALWAALAVCGGVGAFALRKKRG